MARTRYPVAAFMREEEDPPEPPPIQALMASAVSTGAGEAMRTLDPDPGKPAPSEGADAYPGGATPRMDP